MQLGKRSGEWKFHRLYCQWFRSQSLYLLLCIENHGLLLRRDEYLRRLSGLEDFFD